MDTWSLLGKLLGSFGITETTPNYPRCGYDMKIMLVITDKTEVRKILCRLFKIGRALPGVKMADLKDAG